MTKPQIKIFTSPELGQIRTTLSETGQPMFCLADLCKSLGLSNPTVVGSRLEAEEKAKFNLGRDLQKVGNPNAIFVTESGMYSVILRSDSPRSRLMQKWVTGEVLPSIRRNGAYLTDAALERVMADPDFMIGLLTQLKNEKSKNQLLEDCNKTQEAVIGQMAPKALFADSVTASASSCLVGELAKVLNQNGVDIGQNRLFSWLRNNGYLCSRGELYNLPTQQAMDRGLFELKKTSTAGPQGQPAVYTTTKVTGKGQVYFVNRFLQGPAGQKLPGRA